MAIPTSRGVPWQGWVCRRRSGTGSTSIMTPPSSRREFSIAGVMTSMPATASPTTWAAWQAMAAVWGGSRRCGRSWCRCCGCRRHASGMTSPSAATSSRSDPAWTAPRCVWSSRWPTRRHWPRPSGPPRYPAPAPIPPPLPPGLPRRECGRPCQPQDAQRSPGRREIPGRTREGVVDLCFVAKVAADAGSLAGIHRREDDGIAETPGGPYSPIDILRPPSRSRRAISPRAVGPG